MEDEYVKETDDWWKSKGQVESYIDRRKEHLFASHILVFDESICAFIPRLVQVLSSF